MKTDITKIRQITVCNLLKQIMPLTALFDSQSNDRANTTKMAKKSRKRL